MSVTREHRKASWCRNSRSKATRRPHLVFKNISLAMQNFFTVKDSFISCSLSLLFLSDEAAPVR